MCCEEIHLNPHKGFCIAARFEPNVYYKYEDKPISFIDLAIKPQDFLVSENDNYRAQGRNVNTHVLTDSRMRGHIFHGIR